MKWPPPPMRTDTEGAYIEQSKLVGDGVVVVHIFIRKCTCPPPYRNQRPTRDYPAHDYGCPVRLPFGVYRNFARALYFRDVDEKTALEVGDACCSNEASRLLAERPLWSPIEAVHFFPWES